jgi:hypothetical protein
MFQSMFQILLQMRIYISKQVASWLLMEPNFMFLQIQPASFKKIKCILQMCICFLWMVMSF